MKKMIYIGLILLLSGCSDFLKEYSQDLVVAKKVEDFDELMLGSVYMPSLNYGGNYRLPNGMVSCGFLNILDDDISTVRADKVLEMDIWMYVVKALHGYYTWQLEVGKSMDGSYTNDDNVTWNDLYARINRVNVILEEIRDIPTPTDQEVSDKIRIQGECHFLRAQFYLVLVNLYGNAYAPGTAAETLGVPLKLTGFVEHEQGKPTQFDRATVADIYDQIVADLKESIGYFQQSPQVHSYYRASEEAARLLLSRVYLYMQDWENARKEAGELLNMNIYLENMLAMNDSTSVLLNEDSPEILFSQSSLTLQKVVGAYPGDYCVSGELFGLYDTEADKRAIVFFERRGDSIALHAKYQKGDYQSHVSDVLMLRSAEAYLNMAEACAMLDDPDANNWLNKLRKTRIVDYRDQAYSGNELIEQVRLERRKELCFEGHRWFDLRRYAVCEKFPQKKKITHVFNVYGDNSAFFEVAYGFVLKEDDPAYTFAIPKKMIEFDLVGIPDNPREKRESEWVLLWDE